MKIKLFIICTLALGHMAFADQIVCVKIARNCEAPNHVARATLYWSDGINETYHCGGTSGTYYAHAAVLDSAGQIMADEEVRCENIWQIGEHCLIILGIIKCFMDILDP